MKYRHTQIKLFEIFKYFYAVLINNYCSCKVSGVYPNYGIILFKLFLEPEAELN